MKNDIAIVGMSGRFPNGLNVKSLWQLLVRNGNTFEKIIPKDLRGTEHEKYYEQGNYVFSCSRLDRQDLFDAKTFKCNPTEALLMDPQHRIFLSCCREALEYAAIPTPESKGLRTGVFAGCSISSYFIYNILRSKYAEYNPMQLLMSTDKDFISTRVAYKLNLRGPAVTVQTGCSTSLVAVHQAYKALITGEVDMALAGGSSVDAQGRVGYFYTPEGALSSDGICRPFDAEADGTVFSDSVGVVVLCRLEDAIKHDLNVLAIIKSSAINNNGNDCAGFAAPSINGQAEVIEKSLTLSGLEADEIVAVEAHGTGTKLGDPIEIKALNKVFPKLKEKYCAVSSIKANIGHTDVASGIVGLIKAVLTIKHQLLPAQINLNTINPLLELDDSPFFISKNNICLKNKKSINIGVSSFGFGGTNVHIILSPYQRQRVIREKKSSNLKKYLLPLSAPSKDLLSSYINAFKHKLETLTNEQLENIQYTLLNGRTDFQSRAYFICSDVQKCSVSDYKFHQIASKPVRAVFVFPGQGTSWGYASSFYNVNHIFRKEVDKFVGLFKNETGKDLLPMILTPNTELYKTMTSIVQPVLFILSMALSRLLYALGVIPSEVLGHSLGEITAACFSGILSEEDAVKLVSLRAELMETKTVKGTMIVIFSDEATIKKTLKDLAFEIAAYNDKQQIVISTHLENELLITDLLVKNKIKYKLLPVKKGFHSSLMDPIMDEWRNSVKNIQNSKPAIAMMSTLLSSYIRKTEDLIKTDHWVRHLRKPVYYYQGITEICKSHSKKGTLPLFIELGGSSHLSFLAQEQVPELSIVSISDINNQINEDSLQEFFGDLWLNGYSIDKRAISSSGSLISLPISELEESSFWITPNLNENITVKFDTSDDTLKDCDSVSSKNESTAGQKCNIENSIKEIIGSAFKLPASSVNDDFDFFANSGQSMLATMIILRIRKELQLTIPLDLIYNFPVVSDFIREVISINEQCN